MKFMGQLSYRGEKRCTSIVSYKFNFTGHWRLLSEKCQEMLGQVSFRSPSTIKTTIKSYTNIGHDVTGIDRESAKGDKRIHEAYQK